LALRIGEEVSKRIDMARFTAQYQAGLWVNDLVTITDDTSEISHNYRINTIAIRGICETPGNEQRQCDILAEKVN